MSRRTDKVAMLIQRAVSEVIRHDLSDPHIGFVTVTNVKVSPDLRSAVLYVSVLGQKKEIEDSLRHLRRALGYIGRKIAPKIDLRFTPTLSLVYDDTELKADRIERLIDDLQKEEGE
jgi:ribosome-binding factor A